MIELTPQTVIRGDGTTYRARKPPAALTVHLCGYDTGLLVLRCHDRDTAVAAVLDALDGGEQLPPLDPARPGWSVDELARLDRGPMWVRYVIQYAAYERELRGTAGATPAYLFASIKPDPGHPTLIPTGDADHDD